MSANETNRTTETKVTALPTRWIGIRLRVKKTADGEAKPTEVSVLSAEGEEVWKLETEQDELDFIFGKWPKHGKFRVALPDEDFSKFLPHHVIKDSPTEAILHSRPLKPTRVPVAYEGLQKGDTLFLTFGGIGDRFAYAASRNGIAIRRIPPYILKTERGEASKDDDAGLLARLGKEKSGLFRPMAKRDEVLVKLRERQRLWAFIQQDRKACAQRVRQSVLGDIFCSGSSGYPEGTVEQTFDSVNASDPVFRALVEKEKVLVKEIEGTLKELPIYTEILSKVKGIGPLISARIIASAQDIRLFETAPKFKAFCGLHVLKNGTFPRQRRGERCNWNPTARQAFFLAGDMFNKFPDGFWGIRLRENKVKFRAKHPDEVPVQNSEGKMVKRYTKGHIHKMASWRTVSEFAEWLWWRWRTLEGFPAKKPEVIPPEDEPLAARLQEEKEGNGGSPTSAPPTVPDDSGEVSEKAA